jgi:hypothetical protein
VSKNKKEAKLPKQAENAKRGAAGSARSTVGRSRVFKDRTIYDRTDNKREIENMTNVGERTKELLDQVPIEFRGALSYQAYQTGHAYGDEEILNHLTDLVEMIKGPIAKYTARITRGLSYENNQF